MRQQFRSNKKQGWYRGGRVLRTEALERREVLSAAGLANAVQAALGSAVQSQAGDCQTVQVSQQDCNQTQQQDGLAQHQHQLSGGNQSGGSQNGGNQNGGNQGGGSQVGGTLDAQETADLLHMREEEKLARDVYQTLGDLYDVAIFDNIAASEQQHMDSIKNLIDKYGLEDPVTDDAVGVFQTEAFQNLYDQLVARGTQSLADAYQVGIDIEVLDIDDLQVAIDATDNADVTQVYSNLLAGSQNHLAAFTAALAGTDSTGTGGNGSGNGSSNSGSGQATGQNSQNGQGGQSAQQNLQLQQQDQLQTNQQESVVQARQQQLQRSRDGAFEELGNQVGTQVQDRLRDPLVGTTNDMLQQRTRSRL